MNSILSVGLGSNGQHSWIQHRKTFRHRKWRLQDLGKDCVNKCLWETNCCGHTLWDWQCHRHETLSNEKQLKAQILDANVKHIARKPVSPPSHTDLAPVPSAWDEGDDFKAEAKRTEHRSRSRWRHRWHCQEERILSTSSISVKSDKSPSHLESRRHSTHNLGGSANQWKQDRPKVMCLPRSRLRSVIYQQHYLLTNKSFKKDENVIKKVFKGQYDYKCKEWRIGSSPSTQYQWKDSYRRWNLHTIKMKSMKALRCGCYHFALESQHPPL